MKKSGTARIMTGMKGLVATACGPRMMKMRSGKGKTFFCLALLPNEYNDRQIIPAPEYGPVG